MLLRFVQISFRIFQNFAPKTLLRESKTFERPFTRVPKIRFPLPHSPHGSPKSSTISLKNFQYLLPPNTWHLYICPPNIRGISKGIKGRKQAQPGPQNCKRVCGEFCSESCDGFCSGFDGNGFDGASSVNLAARPFSKTHLNLQATHKNLPRKATTSQSARRCKYSFSGIR